MKFGKSGRPGLSGSKIDPRAAVGVMLMPVGRASGAALEDADADAGGCGFDCPPNRVCPNPTVAAIAKQPTRFLSVMTFPRFSLKFYSLKF
jgi:hypothetical protein